MSISDHVRQYISAGMDKKEAMKQAAKDRGISKSAVYGMLLEEEGKEGS